MAEGKSAIDDETRRILAKLASSRRTRLSGASAGRGARWKPEEVRNPRDRYLTGSFTEDTAWNLIVEKLREDYPVETIRLAKPPGATGHVMKIRIEAGTPRLYIKVEMGRTRRRIFGRSFHYSIKLPRT